MFVPVILLNHPQLANEFCKKNVFDSIWMQEVGELPELINCTYIEKDADDDFLDHFEYILNLKINSKGYDFFHMGFYTVCCGRGIGKRDF